jgi:hypothetical protein
VDGRYFPIVDDPGGIAAFHPGGIAAGDTLSLATIALGYLFFIAVTLFVSTFAAFPIMRCIQPALGSYTRWLERRKLRKLPRPECLVPGYGTPIGSTIQLHWKSDQVSYLFLGVLCFLMLAAGFGANWSWPLIVYVAYMAAAGSLLSMWTFGQFRHVYCRWPRRRDPSRIGQLLEAKSLPYRQAIVLGTVVGVLSLLLVAEFQDKVFQLVGFRAPNVSIRMTKDDFLGLMEEATDAGIALNPCKPLRLEAAQLHHVDVLLHKIGSSALLSYPATPEFFDSNLPQLSRRIRFGPLNSSFTAMERNSAIGRCDEFLLDSLFAEESVAISPKVSRMLRLRLGKLAALAPNERVVVTVFGGDDRKRSFMQAEAIGKILQIEYGFMANNLSLIVDVTRRSKLECAGSAAVSARLCARVNQRVEISVNSP